MKRALEEFVIDGTTTTIPFHLKLMENKQFLSGEFDAKFLEENTIQVEN